MSCALDIGGEYGWGRAGALRCNGVYYHVNGKGKDEKGL